MDLSRILPTDVWQISLDFADFRTLLLFSSTSRHSRFAAKESILRRRTRRTGSTVKTQELMFAKLANVFFHGYGDATTALCPWNEVCAEVLCFNERRISPRAAPVYYAFDFNNVRRVTVELNLWKSSHGSFLDHILKNSAVRAKQIEVVVEYNRQSDFCPLEHDNILSLLETVSTPKVSQVVLRRFPSSMLQTILAVLDRPFGDAFRPLVRSTFAVEDPVQNAGNISIDWTQIMQTFSSVPSLWLHSSYPLLPFAATTASAHGLHVSLFENESSCSTVHPWQHESCRLSMYLFSSDSDLVKMLRSAVPMYDHAVSVYKYTSASTLHDQLADRQLDNVLKLFASHPVIWHATAVSSLEKARPSSLAVLQIPMYQLEALDSSGLDSVLPTLSARKVQIVMLLLSINVRLTSVAQVAASVARAMQALCKYRLFRAFGFFVVVQLSNNRVLFAEEQNCVQLCDFLASAMPGLSFAFQGRPRLAGCGEEDAVLSLLGRSSDSSP